MGTTGRAARPRRTAAQWAELVAAWRQSGQSAEAFARSRGLAVASLRWWAWSLDARRRPPPAPRLVPVVVTRDAPAPTDAAWEIRTARGHVLRVHRDLPRPQLRALVAALLRAEAAE